MLNSDAAHEKKGDICPHQIAFLFDNWIRRLVQSPKKVVGEYIKTGDTVLDVGCGPGYFAVDMAKMVGAKGKVIAADLQPQMLKKAEKKAKKRMVADRMVFHHCVPDGINYRGKIDFALAFYMIHETKNPKGFLKEMAAMLNPNGKILVVEPKMHVSRQLFESLLREADEVGLQAKDFPTGKGGRSVLLTLKDHDNPDENRWT